MKRLYNFDSLKMVCAILIIFLHIHTPYQEYILPLTRCAVPCFFMISGFLIYSEDKTYFEKRLKRGIKRITGILIWSTVVFMIVKFIFAIHDNDFSFLNLRAFVDFILFNENPFGFHLWYIGAYLYTLIIVLVFSKNNKIEYIYWAIPILLLTDLCLGKYSIVLLHREFPVIIVRIFLCVGIPYFSIGMFLSQKQECINQINQLRIFTLLGVIIFSILSMIENRILINIGMNATRDHYISTTFLAISLFLLFTTYKQETPNLLSKMGEKDSLYIYIFHPLFIIFFNIANKYLPSFLQSTYLYISPIVILITTILFCITLRKIHII